MKNQIEIPSTLFPGIISILIVLMCGYLAYKNPEAQAGVAIAGGVSVLNCWSESFNKKGGDADKNE